MSAWNVAAELSPIAARSAGFSSVKHQLQVFPDGNRTVNAPPASPGHSIRCVEFLVSVQNLLKKRQITASMFAHAGHGQLHIRPFLDLSDPIKEKVMTVGFVFLLAVMVAVFVWDFMKLQF